VVKVSIHSNRTSERDFWNTVAGIDSNLHQGLPTPESLSIPFSLSSDRRFLEAIGRVSSLSILEVGSGFGDLSLLLSQMGGDVIGLDISDEMISCSRARSKKVGLEATFVLGDAQRLPFEDESLDLVVGMRAIHHFAEMRHFFSEVHRVLKPGGRAIFVEPQKKNPIVEFNRKVLHPECRTENEHPLVRKDIEDARAVFSDVHTETFYLVSPVAFLFSSLTRWDSGFRMTSMVLQRLECRIAEKRLFQDYCWQLLLVLTKG